MTMSQLYCAKCNANAALLLASFLENAFVSRVKRRIAILTVKFYLST